MTVTTPVFKAPSVSLSNFIYVVRYVHISGLLRWQLRHLYLNPQVSVYLTLSIWFVTYIEVVCYVDNCDTHIKSPMVSLSNLIYVIRYVYLSGLLRWQLRHLYLKPQVSVYPTLSMWFIRTYKWFATLTTATPVLKAPSVSLSHFIYMVLYVHISGLLRW